MWASRGSSHVKEELLGTVLGIQLALRCAETLLSSRVIRTFACFDHFLGVIDGTAKNNSIIVPSYQIYSVRMGSAVCIKVTSSVLPLRAQRLLRNITGSIPISTSRLPEGFKFRGNWKQIMLHVTEIKYATCTTSRYRRRI